MYEIYNITFECFVRRKSAIIITEYNYAKNEGAQSRQIIFLAFNY